jgi:hypothetical protein
MHYGEGLNRITRVSASALHAKPLHNLVEAPITWETSGVELFPNKNGSPQGDCPSSASSLCPCPVAWKVCFLPNV